MTDEMAAALVPIGHLEALGPCDYREWRPPDGAPPTLARIWRSEVRETGPLHVVPDGCVELVRAADGTVEVWGPAVRSRQVLVERGAGYDGIRLRAGAAAGVLGLAVADLTGAVVPAVELGALGRLDRLARERWLTGVLALAEHGTAAWRQDAVASRAPAMLARPGTRITSVAAALGIGERQLHRRFTRAVGLSPSAYRRLIRTRHALRDLSGPAPGPAGTIADIAHRRGFTDQSHLTREVVALTGLTPARLR